MRIEVGVGRAHGVPPPPPPGPGGASAFGHAHGVPPPPGPSSRPPQPQELGLVLRHQIQLEMAEGVVAAHEHEEVVALGIHKPGGARPPLPTGPAECEFLQARGFPSFNWILKTNFNWILKTTTVMQQQLEISYLHYCCCFQSGAKRPDYLQPKNKH